MKKVQKTFFKPGKPGQRLIASFDVVDGGLRPQDAVLPDALCFQFLRHQEGGLLGVTAVGEDPIGPFHFVPYTNSRIVDLMTSEEAWRASGDLLENLRTMRSEGATRALVYVNDVFERMTGTPHMGVFPIPEGGEFLQIDPRPLDLKPRTSVTIPHKERRPHIDFKDQTGA